MRYVKGWFTLPNIKCQGQYEIDLLAIDEHKKGGIRRYHIESGVSISHYSKLTTEPFSREKLKQRVGKAGQRRTLGYFVKRKFGPPKVLAELNSHGFVPGNYRKIIVTWGWEPDVPIKAGKHGVELWDFRDILKEIAESRQEDTTYYTDDTMRTLQLMALALKRKGERTGD